MASATAQSVLLARAHLSSLGIIDDPLAHKMLRSPWRSIAWVLRLPGLRQRPVSAVFHYLAVRTLYFDGVVKNAIDDGIQRIVIVGAGYDSRAWRLARAGVEFVEIDHPGTQADKRRRAPIGGPTFVPADLQTDPTPIATTGEAPVTLFVLEGLTMYLREGVVENLLRSFAAPGNRLAVNFSVGGGSGRTARRAVRAAASAGREGFRYEPTQIEAISLLERTGWTVRDIATGADLADRYRNDTGLNSVLTDAAFVVSATS